MDSDSEVKHSSMSLHCLQGIYDELSLLQDIDTILDVVATMQHMVPVYPNGNMGNGYE